jgi:hypothetical protein
MNKEEKMKHLNYVKAKISMMSLTEFNINQMNDILNLELRNELVSENPSKVYIFNLKETKKKQLDSLINSRKKPRNRNDEFTECRKNFIMDIDRRMGDLRQSE